jgi:pantoate--beta-alanine ligase
MHIFKTIEELQTYLKPYRAEKTIGFVPTMGALHEGHLSLIHTSRQENYMTVCSIYVNPTQFDNKNDFDKYPRIVDEDIELLRSVGCDVLFAPSDAEMYPQLVESRISFGKLENVLEGRFRQSHFNGVGIVVSKLFHIIKPDKAYFGQKDLQQCLIVERLVRDFSFDVKIIRSATVREEDGLAMSSRNRRLSAIERQFAPKIYEALLLAKDMLLNHKATVLEAQEAGIFYLNSFGVFKIDYFEVVDTINLEPFENLTQQKEIAICVAVFLGNVRLIDNLLIELSA